MDKEEEQQSQSLEEVAERLAQSNSNQVAEIVSLLVSDNYRNHPELINEKFNGSLSGESGKDKLSSTIIISSSNLLVWNVLKLLINFRERYRKV